MSIDLLRVRDATHRYLRQTVRQADYTCSTTGEILTLPLTVAAAPDGALPAIVMAADALWRDGMGHRLGVDLIADPRGSFGYKLNAIRRGPFTAVMLAVIEAIDQAAELEVLRINALATIWEQAEDRIARARRKQDAA